jgi:hypothetical protein
MYTINLTDNAGIKQLLDFDYRHSNRPGLYHDVRNLVKQSFRQQLDLSHEIFPPGEIICDVYLEQEKINEASVALACFDAERSMSGNYVFRIYYSVLRTIANDLLAETQNDFLFQFNTTVLHELIHAADIATLRESINIHENSFKLYGNKGSLLQHSTAPQYEWNVQWTLLRFFQIFRNEGIAILGERLLSASSKPQNQVYKQESLSRFKEVLNKVLEISAGLKFSNNFQATTAHELLDKLQLEAYAYGHIVLLDIIKTLHPEQNERIINIENLLSSTSQTFPKDEALSFLKICMLADLSEYIQAVFSSSELNREDPLSRQSLLECCAIIQNEKDQDAISAFAMNISRFGFNKDIDSFKKLMAEIIGIKMEKDELIEGHRLFMSKKSEEDIVADIQQKAERLLPLAINEHNEIAIWALTYLYDDQDLVHDQLAVLGYQDDWLVVDAAVRLIY